MIKNYLLHPLAQKVGLGALVLGLVRFLGFGKLVLLGLGVGIGYLIGKDKQKHAH